MKKMFILIISFFILSLQSLSANAFIYEYEKGKFITVNDTIIEYDINDNQVGNFDYQWNEDSDKFYYDFDREIHLKVPVEGSYQISIDDVIWINLSTTSCRSLDHCYSAWKGSPTDHTQYHCQTACAYYDSGHKQGWETTCSQLKTMLERSGAPPSSCPDCFKAWREPSSGGSETYSSSSEDFGCFINSLLNN